MTITWGQFAWAVGLFLAWNGFLVGIIKVLISREVKGFQNRLEAAEKTAHGAVTAVSEQKQAISEIASANKQALSEAASAHKQALTDTTAALRIEIERKTVCSQHQRMEDSDKEIFHTLRRLHGDIGALVGEIKGLRNTMDMVNQHLINGGK